METIINSPIQLTESAIAEIKKLVAVQPAGKVLRIGAKGGGCSGLTYVLDFDEPKSGDQIFEIEGIVCAMEPAHGIYLSGMQIHWENGLNNRGFVFSNPNASKTCGCGTSFAV
ncbi:MAG: iron-sulfur cluster assembly accessory protein [Bacteroidetes bacterium]|nr:iron-sulfur cluster assembly accessory protein [Bacteroidota bacterium]